MQATKTDVVARLEEAAWQKIRQDDLRVNHVLQVPDCSGQGADLCAPAMQLDGAPSLNGSVPVQFQWFQYPPRPRHQRTLCMTSR